jgi:hypothetical protein
MEMMDLEGFMLAYPVEMNRPLVMLHMMCPLSTFEETIVSVGRFTDVANEESSRVEAPLCL